MPMITGAQKQQFIEQGYLVAKGLLDVEADIEPFKRAYAEFLDSLAAIFIAKANPALAADYGALPFAERVAILFGCSGGSVLDHLDPTLIILKPDYQRQKDLPTAQRPELFRLMRSERLLDGLEALLGPEIAASSVYHINLKLGERPRGLVRRVARAAGQRLPARNAFWGFVAGAATNWHTDAAYLLPDASDSHLINAWIPITEATVENGCLLIVPGSHRARFGRDNVHEALTPNAIALPASPGDVVFMDAHLLHASLDNRTSGEIRFAVNFRFHPAGKAPGRPYLPGFIARSRKTPARELQDAQLWGEMWRAAIDFLSENPHTAHDGEGLGRDEAEAITARWTAATRDYRDWLHLSAADLCKPAGREELPSPDGNKPKPLLAAEK